ncbi:hypothetical protein [Rubritalea tangerina]
MSTSPAPIGITRSKIIGTVIASLFLLAGLKAVGLLPKSLTPC